MIFYGSSLTLLCNSVEWVHLLNGGSVMVGKSSEAPVRVWRIKNNDAFEEKTKKKEEEEEKGGEEEEEEEEDELGEIIVSHSIDIQDSEDMVIADWVENGGEGSFQRRESLVLKGGSYSLKILRIGSNKLHQLWEEFEEDASKKVID